LQEVGRGVRSGAKKNEESKEVNDTSGFKENSCSMYVGCDIFTKAGKRHGMPPKEILEDVTHSLSAQLTFRFQ
jgi:hypothetical protein